MMVVLGCNDVCVMSHNYILADFEDYNVTNVPAIIPVGESQACFQIVATDDTIVEGEEVFTLIAEAQSLNDIICDNTTINIFDNDRKGCSS